MQTKPTTAIRLRGPESRGRATGSEQGHDRDPAQIQPPRLRRSRFFHEFRRGGTVRMPIGRLIRKIGLQLRPKMFALTSSPPSTFPENDDVPITVPNNPNALARSCGGKVTCIIDSTCGKSSAPATPCSARAAIRNTGDGASRTASTRP